ncbi:hypothetical protein BAUCODRAFT_449672 [Baudoinia panamericana UAMH 10762]|uniref:Uncharacterized protein n=1 Tax=Baudoinia panamericana (strain UAMH 10762) TaxID=717646 RepID=M2ML09_BAUPA|nr:uncharacterized protein BAUCODRAFT_449672 [Baudoinia panamericana UAMH 10762]EMC97376.1 hypothetical protein BAUCODRAFT_449672 [Baudoinia panamericana UAMH 10762]
MRSGAVHSKLNSYRILRSTCGSKSHFWCKPKADGTQLRADIGKSWLPVGSTIVQSSTCQGSLKEQTLSR